MGGLGGEATSEQVTGHDLMWIEVSGDILYDDKRLMTSLRAKPPRHWRQV